MTEKTTSSVLDIIFEISALLVKNDDMHNSIAFYDKNLL